MTEREIQEVFNVVRQHNRKHNFLHKMCAKRDADGVAVWMRNCLSMCYCEIFAKVVLDNELNFLAIDDDSRGVYFLFY